VPALRAPRPAPFALALAPIALLAAGCADLEDPIPPPTIGWAECEGTTAIECGTLVVPRDHDDPWGDTFELPVVRRPAPDPGERIGSIVLNPGGPGASGASFARTAWLILPPALKDHFDIVGFDPRGEAGSTPAIDCLDDLAPFAALDTTPDSAVERRAILEQSQAFADGCVERSGELLRHVGTDQIVRDMDLLRQALGDDKLTYVGFSYGTFLGAIYADTFPDRVRALVLDGVVNPALTAEELIAGQAFGFEEELHAYFDWCASDAVCVADVGGDPAAVYDEVQAAIEDSPLPSRGERPAGPGEFAYGVVGALYRPSRWDDLTEALAAARAGDGSALVSLADGYLGRRGDGTYENTIDVYYTVTSIDTSSSRDPEVIAEVATEVREKAPRLGAYLPYTALPSVLWPVAPWRVAGPVSAPGVPPVLIVGGTRDPATPLSSAVALSGQLSGSVLLTRDADGHTSFLAGSPCVDDAVTEYLVSLKLPAQGTVCSD
jgi:pimeloyl-ACP methyl ester carboxylesterase